METTHATEYRTPAEEAARLRAAYKAKGWNRNFISVRAESYSMGSSIHVEIKRAEVPLAEAQAIAETAEHIDRDSMTGEILSGGNRYVHVKHSRECAAIIARREIDALEAALAKNAPRGTGEPVGGHADVFVFHTSPNWAVCSVDGKMGCEFWIGNASGIVSGAYELAMRLEERAHALDQTEEKASA